MTLIKSRNSAREATTPQTAQELTLVLSTIRAWKYLRGALRFNMFPLYYTLIWSYAQVTRFISMWWYKFYYSNFGADLLRFIIIAFLLAITETSSSVKIAGIIFRGVSCGRGVAKYINMNASWKKSLPTSHIFPRTSSWPVTRSIPGISLLNQRPHFR